METKKRRALALLACTAFLIAALFSVLFLVREADHDCIGEGCPICACIRQGEQTLKQLGLGSACVASWPPVAGLLVFTVFFALQSAVRETPVSKKVRLNN